MPILTLTSFNLFRFCMKSDKAVKKGGQEENKKEICDVPMNPTSFSRFCGSIYLKDLIEARRKRSKKR